MKLAAIDIGTNSTRLLINDYRNNMFFTLERKMEITRLGSNLDKDNVISKDSARRTIKVLSTYWNLIRGYNVKKYRAIGTSALRKASNSNWFVSSVEELPGIKVDVISGKEEARLSFYGAVRDLDLNYENSISKPALKILVIDIGGGSSEFILGDYKCNLEFTASVDIGCVSLTEKFINSGLQDIKGLNQMRCYIRDKLRETIGEIKKFKPVYIIGVAGTITTLAAIDLKLDKYDSEKIHGYSLSLKRIREIYDFLYRMDIKNRKKVAGLHPKRADIIVGGAAIVIEVLKLLKFEHICVSEKDILDGIIYTLVDF